LANPSGLVLNKFNGKRATRRFIETALKMNEKNTELWIQKYFDAIWKKYDVNDTGIDEKMVPTYLRSLLGDFTAQFTLRDEDRFQE